MQKRPNRSHVTLHCLDCDADFTATRRDAKRCLPCRHAAVREQTKQSYERNKLVRNKRATKKSRERRAANRDRINRDLRERYATDAEYRESRRAFARKWSAIHGSSHSTQARRQQYARTKYQEHKAEHNRKRKVRYQATGHRGDACEVCGLDDERVLTVHHKIPLSRGGTSDPSNLETLCRNCHAVADWEARGES